MLEDILFSFHSRTVWYHQNINNKQFFDLISLFCFAWLNSNKAKKRKKEFKLKIINLFPSFHSRHIIYQDEYIELCFHLNDFQTRKMNILFVKYEIESFAFETISYYRLHLIEIIVFYFIEWIERERERETDTLYYCYLTYFINSFSFIDRSKAGLSSTETSKSK